MTVEATVLEELPSLLFRLELKNKQQVLAHGAGSAPGKAGSAPGKEGAVAGKEGAAARNWVRLLPGDRVEVELAEHDLTRGRILRKIL